MSAVLQQQCALVRQLLDQQGVTQAELARRIGRTQKHVSRVLSGQAGTHELDFWAFTLGYRFVVSLEAVPS